MKRHSFVLASFLLASCASPPSTSPPTFGLAQTETGATEPRSEGYGLQATATTDFIVRYKPGKESKKPRKGNKKRNLRLQGAQLYSAASENEAKELIEELGHDEDVEFAEPDALNAPQLVPSDPQYASQWDLPKINMPAAFDLTTGSSTVKVAVIDSGVNYNHEDLTGQIILGHDYYANDADPMDDFGHGTHVAGIIVAALNNAKGVVGVAPGCRVLALKTGGGTSGISTTSANADAIADAVTAGAKVINMSLGSTSDSLTFRAAVDAAVAAGVVVVSAAGNNGNQTKCYPAAYESSISVGSSGTTDARSSFSNYGSWVTIAAPGEAINNTLFTGGYGIKQGTSMAAPHVAGAAALVCTLHPTWTVEQVRKALETTGAAVTGFTGNTALKRLNVLAALQAAAPTDGAATFSATTVTQSTYSALIKWNASEPVVSGITYGTSPTLTGGLLVTNSAPTTRAGFTMAGLAPGTTYYYRLQGTDPAGNVTLSAITPLVVPAISMTAPKASSSIYSPLITWTTGLAMTSQVYLGTVSTSLSAVGAATTSFQTAHKKLLTGLVPNTTYFYQAKSVDVFGNIKLSAILSFKTGALTFTAPMAKPTKYGLGLTWLTSAPMNDQVQYGTNPLSLASTTTLNTAQSMSHLVTWASLLPNTKYYYQLTGTDPFGNAVASAVLSFTTLPLAVSEIQVTGITSSGAQLNWRTNSPTNHQVFYGLTNLVTSSQTLDGTLATAHSATLTGLAANTVYYYQLRCKDASNNTINSGVLSFKTLP